jgi:[acyl-carrier-protein] S-malonyltransferase
LDDTLTAEGGPDGIGIRFPRTGGANHRHGPRPGGGLSGGAAVFETVDDALGEKLSDLIWEGDIETLTLTRNAQPALMATSMAAMAALKAEGVEVTAASFVAGHSLGEYSALCAAGALDLADAARLLRVRGDAMQAAVPQGEGAMAAILGLDFDAVSKVVAEAAEDQVCAAANDNDPAQVVVSGHLGGRERAVAIAKDRGAKRAVMLPVSAPFHCALMQPAADAMAEALGGVAIKAPAVPLVGNVTAEADSSAALDPRPAGGPGDGPRPLAREREWMAANGVTEIWEIGAGKALSGMIRRIDRSVETRAVGTAEDVAAAAASLGG